MTKRKVFTIISLFVCITLYGYDMQNEGLINRNEERAEQHKNSGDEFDCEHQNAFCYISAGLPEKPTQSEPSVADPVHVAQSDSLNHQHYNFEWQTRTGIWFKYLIRWIRLVIALS